MSTELTFDPVRLPPECQKLRSDVRQFLAEELEAGTYSPHIGGLDRRLQRGVQPQDRRARAGSA